MELYLLKLVGIPVVLKLNSVVTPLKGGLSKKTTSSLIIYCPLRIVNAAPTVCAAATVPSTPLSTVKTFVDPTDYINSYQLRIHSINVLENTEVFQKSNCS